MEEQISQNFQRHKIITLFFFDRFIEIALLTTFIFQSKRSLNLCATHCSSHHPAYSSRMVSTIHACKMYFKRGGTDA